MAIIEIFRLMGTVLLNDQAAQVGLDNLDRKAKKVDSAFGGMLKSAAAWGAGLLSVYAIGAFTKRVFASTEALFEMSERLGMSIERLQELKFATGQAGVSFDSLTGAMAAMTRLLMGAELGGDVQAAAFKRLGVEIYETGGALRSTGQIFEQAFANLADMGNETERNGLAMKIFGRGASELIPFLNLGSEGIAALSARAHELGLVLPAETVKAADDFGDTLKALGQVVSATAMRVIGEFLPALQKTTDWTLAHIPEIGKTFEVMGTTIALVLGVKVIGAIADFVTYAGRGLRLLSASIQLFFAGLGPVGWGIIAFTAAVTGLVLILQKAPKSFSPAADAARSTGEEFGVSARRARDFADGIEDAQSASEAYWKSRELQGQKKKPDAPSVIDPLPPKDPEAEWLKYWETVQGRMESLGGTLVILDKQWELLQARMTGDEDSFEHEAGAAAHLKAETAELDRQIVELTATWKSLVAMKGEDAAETRAVLLVLLDTQIAAANLAAGIRLTSDEIRKLSAEAEDAYAPLNALFLRGMDIVAERGWDIAQFAGMRGGLMAGAAADLTPEQKAAQWAAYKTAYPLAPEGWVAESFEREHGYAPPAGHTGGRFVVPGGGEALALLRSGEFVLPEAKTGLGAVTISPTIHIYAPSGDAQDIEQTLDRWFRVRMPILVRDERLATV